MSTLLESTPQLRRRIGSWQNNVLTQTNNIQSHLSSPPETHNVQNEATSVTTKGYSLNGVTLRPTARRVGLQELPLNLVNRVTRKRKRTGSTMSKRPNKNKKKQSDDAEPEGAGGTRYAERTTRSCATTRQQDLRANPNFAEPSQTSQTSQLSQLSQPSSAGGYKTPIFTPAPSSSRPSSPRKSGKSAARPLTESEVTIAFLRNCEPAVIPYSREDLRKDGIPIPPATEELYQKIRWSKACIPNELKESYESSIDTPTKSKEPIAPNLFLPHTAPYTSGSLPAIQRLLDHVSCKAVLNHKLRVHEKEWGAIVGKFLTELEMQSAGQAVNFNTETIPIQPDDFRPQRPDNQPIISSDTRSEKSTEAREARDNLARMVDWCFCLQVDRQDLLDILSSANDTPDRLRSLNQTFSFLSDYPIIFEVEVKKTYQVRDPLVQLAVWASGGLLKKRAMDWDRSMPMPGITVEGHGWQMYLFFESGERLIMMGPVEFGSTASLDGTWQIMHHLQILMEWGTTGPYFHWFQDQILGPARRKIGKEDQAEERQDEGHLDRQMPVIPNKKKVPRTK